MRLTRMLGPSALAIVLIGVGAGVAFAEDHKTNEEGKTNQGVGKGETSQQQSQQGIGVEGAGSSNVMLGGPEIIIGQIEQIDGEMYAIKGDRGQSVKLRVTKDTNMVCAGGEGAQMTTSRGEMKERKEIPISPGAEKEMKSHDPSRAQEQMQALNDPNRQQAEHEMPPPSKDPSQLKGVVGSTDEAANKDVARGSGFAVGGGEGCHFKAGDHVRVEASDVGTITTIKALDQTSSGSRIAEKGEDQ